MAGHRKPRNLRDVARDMRSGDTAVKDPEPAAPAAAGPERRKVPVMQVAKNTGFQWRYQLAPFAGGAATLTLGAAGTRSPHGVALVLIAATVCSGAWWLFTRRWLNETKERVYAAVVLAAALTWLTLALAHGVTWRMFGVSLASWFVLSWPWWYRHRVRPQAAAPATSNLAEIWTEKLAGRGRALPGSALTDVQRITHGHRATIVLDGGTHSTNDAVAATPKIASAYRRAYSQVVVEPTPTAVASEAQLTLLDDNPLSTVREWDGPTYDPDTGCFDYGVHADGSIARFQLLEIGSGSKHSLVCGTTGSGKSGGGNLILAEAHLSRRFVIWLADPQNGQSLPDWLDHVDWAAIGAQQSLTMLRAYRAVVMGRSHRLARVEWTDDRGRARRGKDHYDYNPDMPPMILVLEEAHELLNHPDYGAEAVKCIEAIGKMGRKTGQGGVLVTQLPSLYELGGSQTLRSMVTSGNVITYRTGDRVSGAMAFGSALPVDPNALPRHFPDGTPTQGLHHILGPAARLAPARSYRVTDPHGVASSVPPLPVDDASALDAGPAYATRHDADPDDDAAPQATVEEPQPEQPSGRPALHLVRDTAELNDATGRVLAALDAAPDVVRTRDLIDAADRSPKQLNNIMRELCKQGMAEKVKHGHWRRVR